MALTLLVAEGSFAAPAKGAQAVFVVYNNEILEYTTTGVLVRTLTGGPAGSFRGLAFGVDGYLYVTNTFPCNNGTGSCNELERFDPNTGAYLGAAGSIAPSTNPFSGVSNNAVSSNGLALGPANDLYLTTNSLGLYQIDPVANTTVPIPTCDCGTNGVAFLPDGTPLTIGGSQNIVVNDITGAAFNTGFFTAAQGLAFGPDGRLYVLEFHQIDTVPATGGAYTPLTVPNALSLGFFITFDAQGNIWVSDQGYGVREFSSVTGQQIGGFTSNLASRFGGIALGPLVGDVWAWGDNSAGELGNGTLINSNLPLQVSSLSNVTAIAGGESHSLALKKDGSVWAWGGNDFGQLGNGTGTNSTTPVQASGLSGAVAVAGGTVHSLALKNDGTAWTWGNNAFGELGDGTTNNALSPVEVTGLSGAIAVSGGQFYSLALKSDGTVWAWGFNGFGQLGNGTTTDSHTPTQVSNLTGVIAISAGYQHALALRTDGTVWTWGNNANGQLGDGTTVSELTPVQVIGLAGVIAIAGGNSYSLALKNDGTVWAWGLNNAGQLGNRTTTDSHTPAQLSGISTVAAISAGNIFAMALRSDGTVWTWGDNSVGELGNGTLTNSLTPVQASNLSGVVAISAGGPHGLAIESHAIGLAAHFTVFTPASATAGTAFNFAVTVVDASNNRVPGYIGTVHFTSTDPLAVLPSDYTFTASDYGAHTFSATTLNTAGSQTIGAADTANSAINGMSGPITINSAAATHLTVSAPASVAPGTSFSVTVSALDAPGNISTGYTGTVHFSSSDPHAALPPDYTFTAADAGVHTFSATLNTPGSATVIATDTANATISGISNAITVSSPLPPPPVQITDNEPITVTDAESFPDIFDPESVHVSDGVFVTPLIAVAAPVVEFSAGGLGFGAQSGTQTITASDIGQASLTLASAAISGGAQFSISQISCSNGATSLPTVLPSGGVCSLTITYTASTTPANDTAILVFTDNAALSNLPTVPAGSSFTQSVPLNGSGATTPPPLPPPAVISLVDNETIHAADTESTPDVFDQEKIAVTDTVVVTTSVTTYPTTISIQIQPATVTYPGPITLTAMVQTTTGAPVSAGFVRFVLSRVGGGCAVSVPLLQVAGGRAVSKPIHVCGGAYRVRAAYTGNGIFLNSRAHARFTVVPAGTSVELTSSASMEAGTPVLFTATVTTPALAVPNGSVQFLLGNKALATVALTNGVATFTDSNLPVGQDSFTASYGGNNNFAPSTSSPAIVTAESQLVNGVTYSFPADFPAANQTELMGINDSGTIVGFYKDGAGTHGLSGPLGRFAPINVPFSGASLTAAFGINNQGTIVGRFLDGAGEHGFLDAGGAFSSIDVSNLACSGDPTTTVCPLIKNSLNTIAFSIDDADIVSGIFTDSTGHRQGFLENGGTMFSDCCGLDTMLFGTQFGSTVGISGNDASASGLFANLFVDIDQFPIRVPGASLTQPFGLSASGAIVGFFIDAATGTGHGFLDTGVTYSRIDVPGALNTHASGINAQGQIVGFYSDSQGTHGFQAQAAVPVELSANVASVTTQGCGLPDAAGIVSCTFTLTNISSGLLVGPFQAVFLNLFSTPVAYPSGTFEGNPFVTLVGPRRLRPGRGIAFTVQFRGSPEIAGNFQPLIFAGNF